MRRSGFGKAGAALLGAMALAVSLGPARADATAPTMTSTAPAAVAREMRAGAALPLRRHAQSCQLRGSTCVTSGHCCEPLKCLQRGDRKVCERE